MTKFSVDQYTKYVEAKRFFLKGIYIALSFSLLVERAQRLEPLMQADSYTSIVSRGRRPVVPEGSPSPKGSTEGIRNNRFSPLFATSVGGNSACKLVPRYIDLGSLSAYLRRILSTTSNVLLSVIF